MRLHRGNLSLFLLIVGAVIFAAGILNASAFWLIVGIVFVAIALLI